MNKYFGFALADSMFDGDCVIKRRVLTVEAVKEMAQAGELTPCLNPSHKATIDAMRARFGIEVEIPETPPRVALKAGDSVVIMGVRGLPRLTDRHEYTGEEIAAATFSFSEYTVLEGAVYVVTRSDYWGMGDMPNSADIPVAASFDEAAAKKACRCIDNGSMYNKVVKVDIV